MRLTRGEKVSIQLIFSTEEDRENSEMFNDPLIKHVLKTLMDFFEAPHCYVQ